MTQQFPPSHAPDHQHPYDPRDPNQSQATGQWGNQQWGSQQWGNQPGAMPAPGSPFAGAGAVPVKKKKTGMIVGIVCALLALILLAGVLIFFFLMRGPDGEAFVREYVDHIAAGEDQEAYAMESHLTDEAESAGFSYDSTNNLTHMGVLSSATERIVIEDVSPKEDSMAPGAEFVVTYSLAGTTYQTDVMLAKEGARQWKIATPLTGQFSVGDSYADVVTLGNLQLEIASADSLISLFTAEVYPGVYPVHGASSRMEFLGFKDTEYIVIPLMARIGDENVSQSESLEFEHVVQEDYAARFRDTLNDKLRSCAGDPSDHLCQDMLKLAPGGAATQVELVEPVETVELVNEQMYLGAPEFTLRSNDVRVKLTRDEKGSDGPAEVEAKFAVEAVATVPDSGEIEYEFSLVQ